MELSSAMPFASFVTPVEWKKVANRPINTSIRVQQAASKVKSKISFLPSYYSLVDKSISEKLHRLGRMSISRSAPKFFTKDRK